MNKFVPDTATIPAGIQTVDFKLRMLTINDLVKDYDAVMSSVEHLYGVFGSGESWPEGLTLEEDLIDLVKYANNPKVAGNMTELNSSSDFN